MLLEIVTALAFLAGEDPTNNSAPENDAADTEVAVVNGIEVHVVEKQIVEMTNAERARHGLPPLSLDQTLLASARKHTAWMTRRRSLTHTTQPVAENIAMGQRSCQEAISSWMRSPGHRANILNGRYRRIGVAAYRCADGTVFWCQQFLH